MIVKSRLSHMAYPHLVGYLFDCPACESRCWCAPNQSKCAHCVAVGNRRYTPETLVMIDHVWHVKISADYPTVPALGD